VTARVAKQRPLHVLTHTQKQAPRRRSQSQGGRERGHAAAGAVAFSEIETDRFDATHRRRPANQHRVVIARLMSLCARPERHVVEEQAVVTSHVSPPKLRMRVPWMLFPVDAVESAP